MLYFNNTSKISLEDPGKSHSKCLSVCLTIHLREIIDTLNIYLVTGLRSWSWTNCEFQVGRLPIFAQSTHLLSQVWAYRLRTVANQKVPGPCLTTEQILLFSHHHLDPPYLCFAPQRRREQQTWVWQLKPSKGKAPKEFSLSMIIAES